ncbi:MAG: hypothetical protein ABEK12_00710, partial [Candidatus Nanohaloarchaea archaeon]
RRFDDLYGRAYRHDRGVLAVPAVILLLAGTVLAGSYLADGTVMSKGIDFTGGTEVHIPVPGNVTTGDVAPAFPNATAVRSLTGGETKWIVVESAESYGGELVRSRLRTGGVMFRDTGRTSISIRSVGPGVGAGFFRDAQVWSGVALLIMSAVIFVAFRSLVPSFAVILAAVTDILVAMAGMVLLGIDLTLGSLAALLMLLGYSVDTDILLSTRVLKQREADMKERIRSSIVTGSTMTFAAIAAFTALWTISTAPRLDQIASVILIGLVADLPVTWLGNAFILKWHVERQ